MDAGDLTLSPGTETVGRGRLSPGGGEGALGPSPKQEGGAAFVHLGPLVVLARGPWLLRVLVERSGTKQRVRVQLGTFWCLPFRGSLAWDRRSSLIAR